MDKSEFGKGLVICLLKFAEHEGRWRSDKMHYEEMHQRNPKLFTLADAVHMHMNAASDHLYDIEVPKRVKAAAVAEKVAVLQKKGLDMGHSFRDDAKWTEEDLLGLYELAREIALLIDQELLGLKPQMGEW